MATNDQWDTWDAFYRMRRRLDRALDLQLQRESSISAAEYELLIALHRSPDRRMRARDLGVAMGWEKSRVSHQLTRMERRGLVERTSCETDARGQWVTLTAEGRRTVLGAMRGHNAALDRFFFDLLDHDDAEALRRFSERATIAIGCEMDEEIPSSHATALRAPRRSRESVAARE